MRKKLSIITVTYNSERTIRSCIESVVSQKTEDIEFVIVDGKSQDKTLGIIEDYKNQIDVLVSEKDSGIYNAMNKAWRLASGNFILYINSDDLLFEGACRLILDTIEKVSMEGIIAAPVVGRDSYNEVLIKPFLKENNSLYYTIPVCHQGLIMKKSLLKKLNGLNETYKILADFDLLLRALENNVSFIQLCSPVAIYKFGGASSGVAHLSEYSRLYREHKFPFFRSKAHLFYIFMSYHLQNILPWRLISLIKKIKKSRLQNLRQ